MVVLKLCANSASNSHLCNPCAGALSLCSCLCNPVFLTSQCFILMETLCSILCAILVHVLVQSSRSWLRNPHPRVCTILVLVLVQCSCSCLCSPCPHAFATQCSILTLISLRIGSWGRDFTARYPCRVKISHSGAHEQWIGNPRIADACQS